MRIRHCALEVSRVILSLVFIGSGLLKAIDPAGTASKVSEYFAVVLGISTSLIVNLSKAIAVGLIGLEFVLGTLMLVGIYRRICSRTILLFMLSMTVLTGYMAASGAVPDCGCFGDAIRLMPWQTFVKNLVLLPMSFFVMRGARRLSHLYTKRERWIPALLALLGISYFIYESYTDMPYKDFRAYKVGYNLPKRMQEADSAMQAELADGTRYVYTRGGERREFMMNEIPTDTTWHYESMIQPTHLATEPLVYNFELITSEGEDITDDILSDAHGVLLLCSPSWTTASQDKIDVYNELYRYAKEHGYRFYSASPSHADAEAEWRYQTGADYPNLFLDATTIKTISRSNPVLLILRSGTIVDKVPASRLPEVSEVPSFIKSRFADGAYTRPYSTRMILIGVWGLFVVYGVGRRLLRRLRVKLYLKAKAKRRAIELN